MQVKSDQVNSFAIIKFFARKMETPRAIQIITPVNHAFQLQLDDLKQILAADHIKDRQCVVISIAGAFRKGKSFLLNFFLRYLHAQVSTILFYSPKNQIKSSKIFITPQKKI